MLPDKKTLKLVFYMSRWIYLSMCFVVTFSAYAGAESNIKNVAAMRPKTSIDKHVTKTILIPGGHYTKPFIVTNPNVEYILEGDMSADGTAIAVRASKVVINLNGKTITYNQTTPGEGVTIDTYNKSDIAIINGSIVQGAALSEGDVYGGGNNPIKSIGISGLHIANINARYGGRDVSGFKIQYVANSIIEGNTLEDVWTMGTMKNRHQGIDAIQATDSHNIVRNNKIINARQRGISIGHHGEVYGNTVSINSLATNSAGIGGYKKQHVKVYDNTIVARGEHPIGIGFVSDGTNDIEIYNNSIDVQATKIGQEYAGNAACMNPATPCGNYAVGFRTTWGGNTINFHDNSITVRTDSRYQGTYSPTGKPVVVNGKGRGLMVAINTGEKSRFYNNKITVLDKDGTGKAFGIACAGGNLGEMIFDGNTVTSNILNVALGDEYGACGGYPLFYRNTFVKVDNYPAYKTIASELGGYFEGTGRFVSNIFQSGASDKNINNNLAGKGRKSVYFGREVTASLQDAVSSSPITGAAVTLQNGGAPFDSTATTDVLGTAKLIVYDYELHNADSTSNKILTRTLAPHTMHALIGSDTYTTLPDKSPTAWDIMNDVVGAFTLPLLKDSIIDAGKKLTLTY